MPKKAKAGKMRLPKELTSMNDIQGFTDLLNLNWSNQNLLISTVLPLRVL